MGQAAHRPRDTPLWRALMLVVIAGFLDAVGFLALAGTFVAFMSGNTSAGGAFAGTLDVSRAFRQLFPLPFFVAGIYIGALVVQGAPPESQRRRYAMVLVVEWGLIALVLAAATMTGIRADVPLDPPARFFGLAAPLAVAMGLQNAMRMDVRGASLATTYVTGTLHVAAQALARATLLAVAATRARLEAQVACSGRAWLRFARPRPGSAAAHGDARWAAGVGATALAVWAGFLVGALAGGALFARAGLAALLLPLALLLVLVMDTLRHPHP